MAKKKKGSEESSVETQEIQIAPKKELVLEGDPEKQLEFAHKAASTLMKWVEQKPKKVMIRGEQYLEFGDWQILGRFYGATVGVEWTKPTEKGWEARSLVYRNGEIISSAEAMCTRGERRWSTADDFAIRSMAQTRASAKALRQAFGWVAELAGMKSTPAEEMDGVFDATPVSSRAIPTVVYDAEEDYRTIDMDEPGVSSQTKQPSIPTDPLEQKKRIFSLLRGRGVDITDGKACKAHVAEITELELTEENYPKIIELLDKYNI